MIVSGVQSLINVFIPPLHLIGVPRSLGGACRATLQDSTDMLTQLFAFLNNQKFCLYVIFFSQICPLTEQSL